MFKGSAYIIVGFSIVFASCERGRNIMNYNYVQLIIGVDEHGKEISITKDIRDTDDIQRLLDFFPEIGSSQRGGIAASWASCIQIEFHTSNGKQFMIETDYNKWREVPARGRGDYAVPVGFRQYIRQILADYASAADK